MIVLQAEDLSVTFGVQTVLDKVSLVVNEGERLGIVGANGSGKTTLLKCLTQQLEADSGKIYFSSLTSLAYLEQLPEYQDNSTIWDVVMDNFAPLLAMRNNLRQIEAEMAQASGGKLDRLMSQYAQITGEYEYSDGYSCENIAAKILTGLGFGESEFTRQIISLSGGEKTRLNMARLLTLEPDVLCLDEPTNYLDMEAVEWLEEYLAAYNGTVILVSHDRLFLDKVASRILEISSSKLYSYPGNYSNYLKLKRVNSLAWEKAYQKQQIYIKKTEAYIERFKAGIKAKQASGRKKQLERLEGLEKLAIEPKIAPWEFNLKQTSGLKVLKVENLSKSYDKKLFHHININLQKGDKVALIGPNGCGKTTLLKIIAGLQLPDAGEVQLGNRVIVGYFSQEFEDLDGDNTILDEIIYNFDITIEKARDLLGRMLFTGDYVLKNIKNLSGGEKARLSILKLILTGANFLILDEPTNHLDIESRLVIEEILADYPGTIILVSHDRYFIDQIASQILAFENQSITSYLGNYSYYHSKRVIENDNSKTKAEIVDPSPQQVLRREQKEKERVERRLKRNLAELEEKISAREKEMGDINTELISPKNFSEPEKLQLLSEKLAELETEVSDLYEKWEELGMQAESNGIRIYG
ncbi:MAG TPA: ABC-F family ATP-binding cassette domain-containing protein [Syntrophomonadaceae bacterium]|nr:ABC-F family ATP-binding cassette domain-containing protein [Syntrophomonadaceae bacterium]